MVLYPKTIHKLKGITLKAVLIAIVYFVLNTSMSFTLSSPTQSILSQSKYSSSFSPPLNSWIESHDLLAYLNDGWKLCYESDQISIYERWIKITDDHYLREKKGEMKASCNIIKAVYTISNHEILKYWMNGVIENTLIKRNNQNSWITYTVFSLPWPFEKRDIINDNEVKVIKPGLNTLININSIDNILPEKKGVTRITKYKTSWNIKKLSDQTVWISYTVSCDNPPPVPRFIQDPILEKTFHQNMVNLRAFIE